MIFWLFWFNGGSGGGGYCCGFLSLDSIGIQWWSLMMLKNYQ